MYKQRENQQMMTVYFERLFYRELQQVAKHKGISLSDLVRLSMREVLDRQQGKKNERKAA